jgi:hypothetical protein
LFDANGMLGQGVVRASLHDTAVSEVFVRRAQAWRNLQLTLSDIVKLDGRDFTDQRQACSVRDVCLGLDIFSVWTDERLI